MAVYDTKTGVTLLDSQVPFFGVYIRRSWSAFT